MTRSVPLNHTNNKQISIAVYVESVWMSLPNIILPCEIDKYLLLKQDFINRFPFRPLPVLLFSNSTHHYVSTTMVSVTSSPSLQLTRSYLVVTVAEALAPSILQVAVVGH